MGAGVGTGAGAACGSSYLRVWTRASGDILVPAKTPVRKEVCGEKTNAMFNVLETVLRKSETHVRVRDGYF